MKNLRINPRGRTVELNLNHLLYPEDIVKKAAEDFGKVCDTIIERRGERINIKMKLKVRKIKIDRVVYDFVNYLLAEVKNSEVSV